MTTLARRPVSLLGLGGYVPSTRVTNIDLEHRFSTTDAWITQRTGVRVRYFCAPGEATGDLAVTAGRRALDHAGLSRVDMAIVATTTPDHPCPGTAPTVASRLDLGRIPAFDIQAVCSGFLYAAAVATSFVRTGAASTVLIIGADSFSSILDPADRATSVIFGDGAGAAVLGESSGEDEWGEFTLGADGTLAGSIQVPGGGSRARSSPESDVPARFHMAGKEVFRAAVDAMVSSCHAALDRRGWHLSDVTHIVGHQANIRILQSVARRLNAPPTKLVIHLDRVGNTAAASIPLALTAGSRRFHGGDKILLTSFGGGATWGATTLIWPHALTATDVLGERDE